MSQYPEVSGALRRQGLRVTPQRLFILDILQHGSRHLSAEEIFAALQHRFPSTDISTVYRTLEVLTNLGMVQRVSLGQSHDHYEWIEEPHHHLVCQRCGAVVQFGDEVLDQVRTVLERQNFRVERAYLEVFGTCATCAVQGGPIVPSESISHEHEAR